MCVYAYVYMYGERQRERDRTTDRIYPENPKDLLIVTQR